MNKQIQKAVEIFNQGGIIIFPTDTTFGIGCRIDIESSIEKLFKIRKRSRSQATPVLVSSLEMAKDSTEEVSEEVIEKLINPFWPGALTIVLQARLDKVPGLVRGYGTTVGVRMPNNDTCLEIIRQLGVPILGPSANFHGHKTPYELKDLDKELVKLVDFVVRGECLLKQASTVIDCTVRPWKTLRRGALDINI